MKKNLLYLFALICSVKRHCIRMLVTSLEHLPGSIESYADGIFRMRCRRRIIARLLLGKGKRYQCVQYNQYNQWFLHDVQLSISV